ncbi:MAG: hypothetical protein JSS81_18355 [Acidobacteria bacterium]|nr:hypothetical protein [Acidobacteriota bacterium]
MKTLSPTEKNDLLLALALAFEKKTAGPAAPSTFRELVEKRFTAASPERFEALAARAEINDRLEPEARDRWQALTAERLRRRGRHRRFDERINPSHIVAVLAREPESIRQIILRNLPADLSRRIALYLDVAFDPPGEKPAVPGKAPHAAVLEIVRRRFLSEFIALEDIYEPDELDRFSFGELENFIHQLGLREIAIACRGINSKETLAAFLNRFDESDAREIAHYITELDKIRPFWVAQADALVRKSWSADLRPDRVIRKIGFKLLAMAYAGRDETRRRYAAQKLSIRDVKNWTRLVNLSERKYGAAGPDDRLRLSKRSRIIERLAVRFSQTGKL